MLLDGRKIPTESAIKSFTSGLVTLHTVMYFDIGNPIEFNIKARHARVARKRRYAIFRSKVRPAAGM